MKHARTLLLVLLGLLVVVGAPFAGRWARRQQAPRCALDGMTIEPLYRVRIVDRRGAAHDFCCIRCAVAWLKRDGEAPQAIRVTDEASGAQINAEHAHFAVSAVVTNPVTGNRVHVFGSRKDAEAHVRAFGGKVLETAELPFDNVR